MSSPFQECLNNIRIQDCGQQMYDAIVQTNDTLEIDKKILLSNKVQQFTGDDVVNLTKIILQRESELYARAQLGDSGDEF